MENHPQTSAAVVQGAGNVTFNNSSLIVQAVAVAENRERNIPRGNEEAKKSTNADHHQLSEFIWIFQDKPLGKRGNVFEGEMRSDVCKPRLAAIKYIPFNERNVKEAEILEKLNSHPHVVAILHSNTVPGPMKYLYIAMERCHTQTLQDFIIDRKQQGIPFDFSLVFKYTMQLIDGMRHIHKNTIIHRDLKPENILFSFDMQSIKISDFGLSKELKSGRSVTNQSILRVGTDGYRAPETYSEDVISLKADIFSLALALYFLWSYGLHPFGNEPDLWNFNIKNNRNRDLKSMLIPQISAAIALLERMLNFEPTLRPTIEEVFQDPCVSELTVPMTLGSNMDTRMTNPSMNLMPNNDQAPDVLIQPNSVPLWSGNIEWKEVRRARLQERRARLEERRERKLLELSVKLQHETEKMWAEKLNNWIPDETLPSFDEEVREKLYKEYFDEALDSVERKYRDLLNEYMNDQYSKTEETARGWMDMETREEERESVEELRTRVLRDLQATQGGSDESKYHIMVTQVVVGYAKDIQHYFYASSPAVKLKAEKKTKMKKHRQLFYTKCSSLLKRYYGDVTRMAEEKFKEAKKRNEQNWENKKTQLERFVEKGILDHENILQKQMIDQYLKPKELRERYEYLKKQLSENPLTGFNPKISAEIKRIANEKLDESYMKMDDLNERNLAARNVQTVKLHDSPILD